MDAQNKVSGVVLAGGRGSRMQHQDKGLVQFRGKALISFPLDAMRPLVDELLISANRNQDIYRQYAEQVISDHTSSFDGPLAGILAAMQTTAHPFLLIAPCDSPFLETRHFQRLLVAMADDVNAAVAYDGERLHPVVLAVRTSLQPSLSAYLDSGERKMQYWLQQQQAVRVDFSDESHVFANINSADELEALENI